MQDHLSKNVWLIGTGKMAFDYATVLSDFAVDLTVIGRSKKRAGTFASKTGLKVFAGGVEAFVGENIRPADYAIVATDILSLDNVAFNLVKAGVRNIMIEKPGGLSKKSLVTLNNAANFAGCNVSVAYNRRFYSSVRTLSRMVRSDGGIKSCVFEFSEWSDVISSLDLDNRVKQRWFLANSTHVVDLVFSFIGCPIKMTAHRAGELDWHRSASVFVGTGITERTVPFSWHANWDGPGRWGIEFVTAQNRYYLRPMESLSLMEKGKVSVTPVEIQDTLDEKYKPGIYRQVSSFLSGGCNMTCKLEQHLKHWDFYLRMAGYPKED